MSVLVVGLSHKSASLSILERAVVSGDALGKLLRDLSQAPNVAGAFVVSTCNRAEVYAEVDKFHGGVSSITDLLARHSGIPLSELTPHLYVHYEDRAVQHLLAVACGLDSMVIGESQILGQVRQALGTAREQRTLSRGLGELGALALRTGKRAHTETRIDQAGTNLVSVGIAAALERLGQAPDSLAGRTVLIVGAGSMSSLAATTAARMDAAHIVVANRTMDRAGKLAATVAGSTAELTGLAGPLAGADLVISCTGATGVVITAELVDSALRQRTGTGTGRTGPAPLAGRWCCSTWPCRGMWTRTWRCCPGCRWSAWTRWAAPESTGPRPGKATSRRSGPSWPTNSPAGSPPCTQPGSRRPWSRCGPRRPPWWTRNWPGWKGGCGPPIMAC